MANWTFEPTVVLGIVLVCFAYALAVDFFRERFPDSAPVPRLQVAYFALAMFTVAIALVSPIDYLADHVALSWHMVQHLLLTLVMPPLLLMGLPGWMLRPALRQALRLPLAMPLLRRIFSPLVGFIAFNAVFAGWHVPWLYELALDSEPLHVVEHLLFMGTALLAWWPIVSPLPELPRVPYPAQVLYLFLQAVIPTVLGAIITFADSPLYPTYESAGRALGFSALEDQQWAGLIMWIPGSLIYLIALTTVFFIWFEGQEKVGEIR